MSATTQDIVQKLWNLCYALRDDGVNASKPKRGRRTKKTKAKKAPVEAEAEPEPPKPKAKKVEPVQPTLQFDTGFVEMEKDDQAQAIADVLFGHGPLDKGEAIRTVAEGLREQGLADFKRLRGGGTLHTAIEKAINRGVKLDLLDRPDRGQIRAIKPDAKDYRPEDGKLCVTEAINGEVMEKDEAIRVAAEWAAENLGLQFKRLRTGGVIEHGLATALGTVRR